MKTRLLIGLVLSTLGIAIAASPVVAQKPIPPIQQTAAWKSLESYVSFLEVRRDKPAGAATKSRYTRNLASRRDNAKTRVQALFGQRLMRIASKDDRWQRREIKGIRSNQKRQVQALKARQADRTGVLRSRQAVAQQKVQDRYGPRITRIADQRDRLRKKLAKATNPAKRAFLNRQIKRLQNQINDLSAAQQDELASINSRYAARIAAMNDLFNARIGQAKARAKRLIDQANRAWRKTFRTQLRAAKARRNTQNDLVKTLARRGSGYISEMPAPPPAP